MVIGEANLKKAEKEKKTGYLMEDIEISSASTLIFRHRETTADADNDATSSSQSTQKQSGSSAKPTMTTTKESRYLSQYFDPGRSYPNESIFGCLLI